MVLEIEFYMDDGQKMMYIAPHDGGSGGEYPYNTAEEAGMNVAFFMEAYYPDILKNPNYIPEED